MSLFDFPEPPKAARVSGPTKESFNAMAVDCSPTPNIQTAQVAVVASIPTLGEVREQCPLIGSVGAQFNRICAGANLARHNIYITHACKARVPRDKESFLYTNKGYRHPQWGEMQKALLEELANFHGDFIILLGELAMHLVLDHPRFSSVTPFAGSVYRAEDFPHLAKILPGKLFGISLHPSSTMPRMQPKNTYTIMSHITKFMRVVEDPTLLDVPIEIITRPGFHQTVEFLEHILDTTPTVGYDIEANPTFMTCFALGYEDPQGLHAISVPLLDNKGNYWTVSQEVEILTLLAEILDHPRIPIVAQNGMFDITYTLRTMFMKTDNLNFDTMLAQHICYTDLPKNLGYLTAAYTYFPYHKDEGKASHAALVKDWDSYWKYNAKDAVYLLPIKAALEEELRAFDATDAMDYSMDLHKPLIEMEWNGILADIENISQVREKHNRYLAAMNKGLRKLTGQPLNINSPKQMVAYFYGTLGIKPYINKKTKNASCDALALSRIAKRGKAGAAEARLITKIRYYSKLTSTYFYIPFDKDNKLRCSYSIGGTSSGRLSSSKTFFGTGANLQNQPYSFKKFLVPDPDCLLVELDLARAEAHAVAYLCQDESMIHAFESGIDVHTFNASKIFNIPMEEVTKDMRTMGKRIVHARNYKMGPGTFSDNLAKTFVYYSMSKCKALLDAYSARFPGLDRWHRQIEYEVKTNRVLYNMFGRPKRFLGLVNDAMVRNAISYIPQSTVAELLNRGIIKCANDPRLGRDQFDIDLLTTVHDSVVFQVPYSQLPNLHVILTIMKDHLSHTFTHKGRSFTIGVDAKIGTAWAGNTTEFATFDKPTVQKALVSLGV